MTFEEAALLCFTLLLALVALVGMVFAFSPVRAFDTVVTEKTALVSSSGIRFQLKTTACIVVVTKDVYQEVHVGTPVVAHCHHLLGHPIGRDRYAVTSLNELLGER